MNAVSPLARAVLDALNSEALDELARVLAPRLAGLLDTSTDDGWIDAKAAAIYVGLTPAALYRHTAARTIPFEQDCPGGKCWFKRSELDAWRRGEWQRSTLRGVA